MACSRWSAKNLCVAGDCGWRGLTYRTSAVGTCTEAVARIGKIDSRLTVLSACVVCSLPFSEQKVSDTRRIEIARIWESVSYYMPHQTADHLRAIVRAIRSLKGEGYAADADDESVRYWATKADDTRAQSAGKLVNALPLFAIST